MILSTTYYTTNVIFIDVFQTDHDKSTGKHPVANIRIVNVTSMVALRQALKLDLDKNKENERKEKRESEDKIT